MPIYSRVSPELEITKSLWVISEVTEPGNLPRHCLIIFEGLNDEGEPWLWAAEFMPMRYEELDTAADIAARLHSILITLDGTPGLVRTTDPSPENIGGEKARMPAYKVDDEHLAMYHPVSHQVPKARAKAAQHYINAHEKMPPQYGLSGDSGWIASLFSRGMNCATWVINVLTAAGIDKSVINSGLVELFCHKPSKRDGAARFGVGSTCISATMAASISAENDVPVHDGEAATPFTLD